MTTGLLAFVPQAPAAPTAPKPPDGGFQSFNDYVKAYQENGGGSEFGSGDFGAAQSEANRMGAGTAPPTAAGLLAAGRNALSAVTGFGLQNPLQMGLRTAYAAMNGQPLANAAFGIHNIPGQTPFDPDLIDKVLSGQYVNGHRYTIGDAAQEQATRNGVRSANNAIANGVAMHVGHPGGGNAGGGSMGQHGFGGQAGRAGF